MDSSLPGLIAQKFIQRRDVKAIQLDNGDYIPDSRLRDQSIHGLGFKKSHLLSHLDGSHTYGHYLIDTNNRCRIFCLDIDLDKTGVYPILPSFALDETEFLENIQLIECNPREAWIDRRNTDARNWYKMQLKMIAWSFAKIITKQMQLPCAVTYSGHKGIHVYGFLGDSPSEECREAGLYAIDYAGEWELYRGKNFYRHRNADPVTGYPSFTAEIYPKQGNLDGKDLGNLLRLPLGRNRKSPKDPTFFLSLTGRAADFRPHPNPVALLESGDPFRE